MLRGASDEVSDAFIARRGSELTGTSAGGARDAVGGTLGASLDVPVKGIPHMRANFARISDRGASLPA